MQFPVPRRRIIEFFGDEVGGILHDLQNGVYSEWKEHRQGRSHYFLSDIMQWYLGPPLLYSKLSMGEYGKS